MNHRDSMLFSKSLGNDSYLKMGSGDAFDQSLEELIDHGFQLRDIANLKNLKHLSQKHHLLRRAGKWPIPQ